MIAQDFNQSHHQNMHPPARITLLEYSHKKIRLIAQPDFF